MTHLDFGCFVGGWPTHKVRHPSFDNLRTLHCRNNIGGGYVSATHAIFWNDPYEAERDLARDLWGQNAYRHVMTVNPTLPGTWDDLRRGEFPVAGIRIFPCFHGYSLTDDCVKPLWEFLREKKLPLFLTPRMEDERTTYLFHPRLPDLKKADAFLREVTGFPVLLCNVRDSELPLLRECVLAREDVFCDTAGFKGGLFLLDEFYAQGLTERVVFGSLSPVHCLRSTLLTIETAAIPDAEKERILSGERFLNVLTR
ncbi:MAG: hypothetical protein GX929_06855 [Clostridiales bacterium]|nr:hypothetical protein [Clostridiales bacterium]